MEHENFWRSVNVSVLVLGGAGYIGSHAGYQLFDEGNMRNSKFIHSAFIKESMENPLKYYDNSIYATQGIGWNPTGYEKEV